MIGRIGMPKWQLGAILKGVRNLIRFYRVAATFGAMAGVVPSGSSPSICDASSTRLPSRSVAGGIVPNRSVPNTLSNTASTIRTGGRAKTANGGRAAECARLARGFVRCVRVSTEWMKAVCKAGNGVGWVGGGWVPSGPTVLHCLLSRVWSSKLAQAGVLYRFWTGFQRPSNNWIALEQD